MQGKLEPQDTARRRAREQAAQRIEKKGVRDEKERNRSTFKTWESSERSTASLKEHATCIESTVRLPPKRKTAARIASFFFSLIQMYSSNMKTHGCLSPLSGFTFTHLSKSVKFINRFQSIEREASWNSSQTGDGLPLLEKEAEEWLTLRTTGRLSWPPQIFFVENTAKILQRSQQSDC